MLTSGRGLPEAGSRLCVCVCLCAEACKGQWQIKERAEQKSEPTERMVRKGEPQPERERTDWAPPRHGVARVLYRDPFPGSN